MVLERVGLMVARAKHAGRSVAQAWVRAEAAASEVVTRALFPGLGGSGASARPGAEHDSSEASSV